MAGMIVNMMNRIVAKSGLSIIHTNLLQYQQRRSGSIKYYQANSIYVENILNKISTDVAMMRFKHWKVTKNEDGSDHVEWLETSALSDVLSYSPNEYEVPIVFWTRVIRKMLEEGIAVVVPKYMNGNVNELILADDFAGYEDKKVLFSTDSEMRTANISDVYIFENPKESVAVKLNQIVQIIDENLSALSAGINERSEIKGFLKLPTKVADETMKNKAQKRINNMAETAKTNGISYLEQGEEFQELSNKYETIANDDLEFLKNQIYQAYGINEKLFTCDYTEEQYRAYYQTIVKLFMRVITEELNRKSFSKTARTQGHKILAYMDIFDVSSLKDLTEFMFKSKYTAVNNSNELRSLIGLPPYDGGNVFESNKNATKIEPNINSY
ncbi:phage portal protein [Listeria innocua]|uniref:phage portal protein n=2 Tax=Listeria innocua TaxID=1642 RepID=UPI001C897519|nr:phage portal protein [Listeria innocua]